MTPSGLPLTAFTVHSFAGQYQQAIRQSPRPARSYQARMWIGRKGVYAPFIGMVPERLKPALPTFHWTSAKPRTHKRLGVEAKSRERLQAKYPVHGDPHSHSCQSVTEKATLQPLICVRSRMLHRVALAQGAV